MTDGPELEKGETILREIRSDKGRYWRDHGMLGLIAMVLVGVVLWLMGNEYAALAPLAAAAAVAVRGLYLASEQLNARWWLTNRRLVLPGGKRSVMLLEIETVRRLMGDIQIITRAGDKHLLKHIAEPEAVVTEITAARDRRRPAAI